MTLTDFPYPGSLVAPVLANSLVALTKDRELTRLFVRKLTFTDQQRHVRASWRNVAQRRLPIAMEETPERDPDGDGDGDGDSDSDGGDGDGGDANADTDADAKAQQQRQPQPQPRPQAE